jgi:CRP-like cAMP-binding protein
MLGSGNCWNITWEGRADCKHCAIRKNDILADIDVEKYDEYLKPIAQYCYPRDTVIYNNGNKATDLYIVRKGLVKLEQILEDGSSRIVRLIQNGSIVGLETFLDHAQKYEQRAVTIYETQLCRIPERVFHQLIKDDDDFFHAVMEQWHEQLEFSSQMLVQFSTGSLRRRIALLLLVLVDEANKDKLVEIKKIPVQDIASITGSTRESVSRVLAEFKRKKLVTKSSPKKLRFDETGLRQQAEE